MTDRKAHLTFKHNLNQGRHGWLRLTPAYSVQVVHDILDQHPRVRHVLDPFSGTGTTGLVCGERAIACHLNDINPFLVWFARVKTANYTAEDLAIVRAVAGQLTCNAADVPRWTPPIFDIDKWWARDRLNVLAELFHGIHTHLPDPSPASDLLQVAFCRVMMKWSNAAFNHQSMSFKTPDATAQLTLFADDVCADFADAVVFIARSAAIPVSGEVTVAQADARDLARIDRRFDAIITSPPYPNRMSYVRELRPYMYWLGYLNEAREAGELDWQAIGGTWGIATSRLNDWQPPEDVRVPHVGFDPMLDAIAANSTLLAQYVHRYFVDMLAHVASLPALLNPGASVHYVVGNSKFYDTLVPVESIFASLFQSAGFVNVSIETIRKRNSKKELFEYIVSAQRP
jgi:hypothetical protein